MPIIKLKSRIEEYKYRASKSDINEMSGRTKNPSLTRYVLNNIAKQVKNDEKKTFVNLTLGLFGRFLMTFNTVETYDKKTYDKKSRPSISKKIAQTSRDIVEKSKNI